MNLWNIRLLFSKLSVNQTVVRSTMRDKSAWASEWVATNAIASLCVESLIISAVDDSSTT